MYVVNDAPQLVADFATASSTLSSTHVTIQDPDELIGQIINGICRVILEFIPQTIYGLLPTPLNLLILLANIAMETSKPHHGDVSILVALYLPPYPVSRLVPILLPL